MDVTAYRTQIKEAALAGYDTPARLADYLFETKKVSEETRAELIEALDRLLKSVDFNTELQRAREDVVGACLESFRETAMQNVLNMKKLANDSSDDRVQYNANKDILDRIGLAPVQKQVAGTPADWAKTIAGLTKKPNDKPGPGSSGVVPSPEVHPEGEPAGDGGRA